MLLGKKNKMVRICYVLQVLWYESEAIEIELIVKWFYKRMLTTPWPEHMSHDELCKIVTEKKTYILN